MKKVLLFAACIGGFQATIAQSGNVGIGTTTPSAKLQVVGAGAGTVDLQVNGRIKTGDSTRSGGIWVHDDAFVGNAYFGEGSDYMGFYSGGVSWGLVMHKANGNVGIGTYAPAQKLHVIGNIWAENGSVNSNINAPEGGRIGIYNNTKTGTDVNQWIIYNMTGGYGNGLQFWRYGADGTNYGSAMTLHDNGNVGIGTASPAYKLDVAGDIIAGNGHFLRTRGNTGWYNETYAGGWYMSDGTWIRTYNDKSLWTAGGLIGSDGGITIGFGGATPPSGGGIIAGNLGIGTSSPSQRLDVIGYVKANNGMFINMPSYASDGAAESDPNLPVGGLYRLTSGSGRQVFIKLGSSPDVTPPSIIISSSESIDHIGAVDACDDMARRVITISFNATDPSGIVSTTFVINGVTYPGTSKTFIEETCCYTPSTIVFSNVTYNVTVTAVDNYGNSNTQTASYTYNPRPCNSF